MRITWLLLILASVSCAYEPPPTAPTIVPPVVVNDPPPLQPSVSLPPLAIALSVGGRMRGEVSHLSAHPLAHVITEPASYRWTFGDGETASTTENKAQHRYRRTGIVEPTVQVTDGDGRTATASVKVRIMSSPPPLPPPGPDPPPPPPPPPTPPPSPTVSAELTCSPRKAGTQTGCTVHVKWGGDLLAASAVNQVEWEWGDGAASVTTSPLGTHNYTVAGTYTVTGVVSADLPDGTEAVRTVRRQIVVPISEGP